MTPDIPRFPLALSSEGGLSHLFTVQRVESTVVVPVEKVRADPQEVQVEVPYAPLLVAATDGSCRGNPGPGGWCWYMSTGSWASGGSRNTTNNIMELMAVREVLAATQQSGSGLHLKVDSKYVIDALTKWVHGWKRNGWKTGAGKPVANKELIQSIHELMKGRDVRFEWVKGHAGNIMNEAADIRACAAADNAKKGEEVTYGPGYTD